MIPGEDEPFMGTRPDYDPDGVRIRRGGCSCGVVGFELRGDPLKVGLCHCTKCRKATGSAFLAYADWPPAAFSFTGEVRNYKGRSFCSVCGSRPVPPVRRAAEINLGALDLAPGDLVLTREGWIVRREHWLTHIQDALQFGRDPD